MCGCFLRHGSDLFHCYIFNDSHIDKCQDSINGLRKFAHLSRKYKFYSPLLTKYVDITRVKTPHVASSADETPENKWKCPYSFPSDSSFTQTRKFYAVVATPWAVSIEENTRLQVICISSYNCKKANIHIQIGLHANDINAARYKEKWTAHETIKLGKTTRALIFLSRGIKPDGYACVRDRLKQCSRIIQG